MSESIKVRSRFTTDKFLMYLIQQTTKQPTDEILGFFYDFGTKVVEMGAEQMKGSSIRKEIHDFYPGTSIPFKMLVTGSKTYHWNPISKIHEDERSFSGNIEVCFPSVAAYVDNTKLMEIVAEKALLGGSNMPEFEKPEPKTPKMYKKLVEDILHKRDHE